MRKFIIIFGPPAVGKMSVGHELSKLTGIKLFHNHMTIDLVTQFFDWGTANFKLVDEFRRRIFEEVAASDLPGLIFTFVWAFEEEKEKEYVDKSCKIFTDKGFEICFVELEADLEVRLERNKGEFRLEQKPSKRDVPKSESILLKNEEDHVLNSPGEFYYPENHLKINNTHLGPRQCAEMIIERFNISKHD